MNDIITNNSINSNQTSKDIAKFFKAYDLRATTPVLDWKVYYLAGQALVTEILEPANLPLEVNVWHDIRLTSDNFYKAFIAGIISQNCEVIACGLGSTEMMYAYTIKHDICGAMITASHNPKDDNGLKIVKKFPQMLGLGTGLEKIRDYVVTNYDTLNLEIDDLKAIEDDTKAKTDAINYLKTKAILVGDIENLELAKSYKIVVDAANGMGVLSYKILKELYPSIEFVPLYCDLDGNFPNHPADPINPDNMKDLQEGVLREQADLGIAFDGDADRAFFVDQKGQLINGENLVAVFAKELVRKAKAHPELELNPACVYVVSYSRALSDTVLMEGGAAIVSKQGHTYVKSLMAQYKAIYGGEASGHHYFGQFGYMDSGLLACTLLLSILSKSQNLASQICEYYEDKYFTSGEVNIKASQNMNIDILSIKLKESYPDAYFSFYDGVTIYLPFWKMTVRGSNTEPLFRINIETRIKNQDINPESILAKVKAMILE